MSKDKVEDVDFGGKLKITKTSDGFDVVVPGSKDVRVKVKGQFVNLHTYALNVGLEDPGDKGEETSTLALVVEGGKLFESDCETLEDFAS